MALAELPAQEIECFLVLAEELHFGRTGERLFISQSRVSQLVSAFERRIGASLVARTSRRVELTAFGAELAASLGPAHHALVSILDDARVRARSTPVPLRVGFQGAVYPALAAALNQFTRDCPQHVVTTRELPLGDPFTEVLAGRLDAAIVLLPVDEPGLVTGVVFSEQPPVLVVPAEHPFAALGEVSAERLAEITTVPVTGPAPRYWLDVHAPPATPDGRRLSVRGGAETIQEGLSQVASAQVGMILCAATAESHRRPDVASVPIVGMPSSALALVWRADRETAQLRRLARTIGACVLPGDAERGPVT
ncbi:transcriptional regulator [Sanguibacter keddieii DSM 10542]|uniref:Transcriptional regulator n=1 Tax=Sanguibacter keddieii (strain ATCC 51767 / DSM 10542 / NCFB 3025 / ST-74) TaxID=446469 RepID=D1BHN7_SANKS|nr:transcriptional regulator [Sanguibacter keddieii DSM 10542]